DRLLLQVRSFRLGQVLPSGVLRRALERRDGRSGPDPFEIRITPRRAERGALRRAHGGRFRRRGRLPEEGRRRKFDRYNQGSRCAKPTKLPHHSSRSRRLVVYATPFDCAQGSLGSLGSQGSQGSLGSLGSVGSPSSIRFANFMNSVNPPTLV